MIRLPRPCYFAQLPDDTWSWLSFRCELDRCCCCRPRFEAAKPLCRFRAEEDEAYRFFWRSSFDGHAVVHIGRWHHNIMLRPDTMMLRWGTGSTDSKAPRNLALSPADWQRLQHALDAAGFWSLAPHSDEMGLDGADWLIEGRHGDSYHAVSRWSPTGPIHDLGRVFFDLSGPPLAAITLY
ncbi:MAG: hypothetical protein OJF62_002061 [Pseudolabrys sp.]|jgi:hypothetical protein|nr:hypothetical protein [Pseudolabrys sp.]